MARRFDALRATLFHRIELLLERPVEAPPGRIEERHARIAPNLWVVYVPAGKGAENRVVEILNTLQEAGSGRITMISVQVNLVDI